MEDRRFDEKQVALILHRAAEATTDGGNEEGATGTGLTLLELKEIGAEAGIEPSRIEAAARELTRRLAHTATMPSLGFPPTVQIERVVSGRIDRDELPHLLDIIRNEFARQGIVEEVLGGFEWKARSVMGGRYVSIRAEGESTRIRVLGNFRDGLLTLVLGPGPILGVLGGLGAAGLTGGNPFLVAPAVLLAWAGSLLPWRHFFRREKRSLEEVLDAIRERIDTPARDHPNETTNE